MTNIALLKSNAHFEESALKAAGFNVWSAQDPDSLYERLLVERIDLLIVDLDQSKFDYFNVIQSLYNTKGFPIITISEPSNVLSQIMAISSGADRNIQKPFNIHLFITNFMAINRDKQKPTPIKEINNTSINAWQLNINKWSIKSPNGTILYLTMKEMLLLKFLVEKNGEFINKDDLHNLVFRSSSSTRKPSLNRLLNQLRKKAAIAFNFEFPLKTVYLVGYAFTDQCNIISDL